MNKSLSIIALSTVLASSTLLSAPVSAVEGLSANAAVTNNYLWRGVTQTNNAAAVSGGLDYAHKSGAYAGTWVSNADWAEEMSYELDFYAGYANELENGIGYDVGVIYYAYDKAAESDFSEVYVSISYDAYSFTYNTLIDSDAGGKFADDTYLSADAEFEVAEGLGLGLHIGRYDFKEAGNYIDYGVALSKEGFTFGVSKTDLSGADGDVNFTVSYAVDFDL